MSRSLMLWTVVAAVTPAGLTTAHEAAFGWTGAMFSPGGMPMTRGPQPGRFAFTVGEMELK